MLGLVLVLLYSGFQYLSGKPVEVFYPAATNFLIWWYAVIAVIVGVIYLVIAVLMAFGLMAQGAQAGGAVGGVLGLVGGGAVTFVLLVHYVLNFGCLIIGSVLLHSAYSGEHWDAVRIAFGAGLVIVGILIGGARSSSSSKKK